MTPTGPTAAVTPQGQRVPSATPAEQKRLKEVAAEFESLFVSQLLQTMRGPGLKGGAIPAAPGREIYQGLMDQELGRAVAHGRGLGLADMLVQQLGRLGGVSSPTAPRPILTGETFRASDGGTR
jgi:Rod binding domain-containing protein